MSYIFFLICLIIYPISQVLEKKGMLQIGSIGSFSELLSISTIQKLISNPYIISGVFLSVIGLFFWLASMSSLKISYLYPVGAGIQQAILVILAVLILHENMSMINWIGIGTISVGVALVNL